MLSLRRFQNLNVFPQTSKRIHDTSLKSALIESDFQWLLIEHKLAKVTFCSLGWTPNKDLI